MPITYFPLNVDVSQVVGFPVKVARLEVSTSLPKGTVLAYGSAGQIAVPGGIYNLAGGIGSLTLPTKTGLTNVSDYQYVITGEYSLDGVRPVKMDPIYIDAPTSTAAVNLASFIGVTSAPPTFMGQAVAQITAAGQASLAATVAAKDEAEAIKAYVTDVSNIDTTVSAVDFALGQPGPAATLSAAIAPAIESQAIQKCAHVSTVNNGGLAPIDSIGGWIYGAEGSTLKRATTASGSWTTVKAFGGARVTAVRETGDGEVVVAQHADGVWKSTGWATNPLTATWTKVLATNAPVEPWTINTNPATGHVGVTTYISGADMSNSRYFWVSKDYGATFTVAYDTTTARPDVAAATSHCHHISFDPYWDGTLGYRPNGDAPNPRAWAVWHKTSDDPTMIATPVNIVMYSDNAASNPAGATWTVHSSLDHHGVIAIATPEGMVMDTDYTPTALFLVPRAATVGGMVRRLLFRRRPETSTTLETWGWGIRAVKGDSGMVHIAMRTSIANLPAGVISTDGITATETITVPPSTAADAVDVVGLAYHDKRLVLSTVQTVSAPTVVQVTTGDAPRRGVSTPPDNGVVGGVAEDSSVAVGVGSLAGPHRAVSVGHRAKTLRDSVAVGHAAETTDHSAVAVGSGTKAGQYSVAVGVAITVASNVTAVGAITSVSSNGTVVGRLTEAGSYGAALGHTAKAPGTSSVAVGRSSTSGATDSAAIGNGAAVNSAHTGSVALGAATATTAAGQVHVGPRHVELLELAADPTAPSNSAGRLYIKDDGTTGAALYFRTATGTYKVTMA